MRYILIHCYVLISFGFLSAQNVGIGTETPTQKLDVNGGLRIGTTNTANPGAIRWNETKSDFEGYNGVTWVSLTGGKGKWGDQSSYSIENSGTQTYLVYSQNPSIDFGWNIDALGEWLVVGCPRDGVPGNQNLFAAGSIRLFKRNADAWILHGNVAFDPDAQTNDLFGHCVDMTQTHIIAGAPFADMPSSVEQGKAYIYTYAPNLVLQATLIASDAGAHDYFGFSVSVDGDYAAVGAPGNEILGAIGVGRVYIYMRTGTTWNQTFVLSPSDYVAYDGYGTTVKLWGDYLAVGTPNKKVNGLTYAGKVYVYKRNGSSWTLIQSLTSPEVQSNERYGQEIEMYDHKLFIGAPDNVSGPTDGPGKIYNYLLAGNTVTYETTLTSSDGKSGDGFGSAIDFLDNTLLVGAPSANDGASTGVGKAYVFKLQNNQYVEEAKLSSSRKEIAMAFGRSVSLVPGFAIISAPKADLPGAEDNGQVLFFKNH
jgi:hypothetical protein